MPKTHAAGKHILIVEDEKPLAHALELKMKHEGYEPTVANNGTEGLKAALTGTLWAEAREVSRNFKIGSYLVDVKDDQGDLVAQFQGLAYRKKDKLPGA